MPRPSLTLVPSGGLANRMRAIVSAYDACQKAGCSLRVIWFRDWALNAPFSEIFEPVDPSLFTLHDACAADFIVNGRPRRRNFWLPRLCQAFIYNKRIDEQEVTPLKQKGFDFNEWFSNGKCWMSCYQEFGNVPSELYAVLFVPVKEVLSRVEALKAQFSPHTIGMHIRRTDNAASIAQSPISLFIEAGQRELAENADLRIFLASDNESVKKEMLTAFGDRIITAEVPASRSSSDGIRGGLVDMYALAATSRIYGSFDSSFSPAAARIGGNEHIVLKAK